MDRALASTVDFRVMPLSVDDKNLATLQLFRAQLIILHETISPKTCILSRH